MNEREQFEAKFGNTTFSTPVLKESYYEVWQAARQSSAAELAKRKASYEELARLHSRLIAELSAAQAKVAELSTHPCLLEDGNFDHDWKFVDDSFDHEFGTETVHYYECKCCNATKLRVQMLQRY